jgi:hypothetical protein
MVKLTNLGFILRVYSFLTVCPANVLGILSGEKIKIGK